MPGRRRRAIVIFMTEWTLEHDEEGLTALEFLRRRLPSAPPAYLRQLLRKGRIRRCGEPLQTESIVRPGDRLQLPNSRRLQELMNSSKTEPPVEILYENRGLLAVFKTSGLAVHRGTGHESDHLLGRVRALMAARREPFGVAPVHRLDAPTSGPVLFGKGRKSTAILGKLFMSGSVEKTYLALVAGTLDGQGLLSSPVPTRGKWKAAKTGYRCLAASRDFSLLELSLHSGRTHQIRRQLSDYGHPLAGDHRYGGPRPSGLGRLFLHCLRLAFTDPFEGDDLIIESALPTELDQFLASRNLHFRQEAAEGN